MTTGTQKSPALKALEYAEFQLGVHAVYESALKAREELDGVLTEIDSIRDRKRSVEREISDLEMDILFEERSKHPEMSAAAMDKHLRLAYHQNGQLKALRENHVKTVGELDGREIDKSVLEADIRIATARMIELGGYLQYLAAVKLSTTTPATPTTPETQGDQGT